MIKNIKKYGMPSFISFLIMSAGLVFADTNSNDDSRLTLDECIETALKNNPEAAASQWDVTAAGFRYDQAKAGMMPSLSVEAGYSHFLDSQRLIPARYDGETGAFDREAIRGDLVIRIPIYTGGRLVNEIQAADLLREAEEHRLTRTREEIVLNVSAIFLGMLGQTKVMESLGFSITVLEEHLKRITELLSAQKASRLDLLKTEVRLADLRQMLSKESNSLSVQKRILINLLGTERDVTTFGVDGELAFDFTPFDPDPLIQRALNERPDYLAAKARVEAQVHKTAVARSALLPQVNLQGSYGIRMDMLGGQEDIGTVGVSASIPLFDGKIAPKIGEEEALLHAAHERLRKLEAQIRQDIETAILDIDSGAERIKAIEKAIEQAKESLRIEREKYDLSAGSMSDVLDAQSALLQTETSYYTAIANVNIAKARLAWATGGAAK